MVRGGGHAQQRGGGNDADASADGGGRPSINARPGADAYAMPRRGRGGAKLANPHGADLTKVC